MWSSGFSKELSLQPCEPHPDSVATRHEGGSAGGAEDGGGDVVGEDGSGLTELVDVRGGQGGVAETSQVSDTEVVNQQDEDVGRLGLAER